MIGDSDIDDSSSSGGDHDNFSDPTKDVAVNTTTGRQIASKRSKKKRVSKSQHSLDTMRQRVSHLMSIFEENGWYIPMPDSTAPHQINNTKKSSGGKVWSNRNYGADKKRQRKQSERVMLETRIQQLEAVLKDEHGYDTM
mmetsp:Transcript_25384/g.38392  ORF Transcript_25384/g.38392 Transcript_25384/m.38392 type:complete len:140 (-) Transcript_25384:611-1030(-)|eukprot:scaffold9890_cov83-Skeletonema_dohrnii-CCMP3373.AAC.2